MIRGFVSNTYMAKKILSYLNTNTIIDKANRHCCELKNNYDVIIKNYTLVKEYALKKGIR